MAAHTILVFTFSLTAQSRVVFSVVPVNIRESSAAAGADKLLQPVDGNFGPIIGAVPATANHKARGQY